jgi:seryl-tRNA synthetase
MISLETLARAAYFSSFPQGLTVASHLSGEADALERIARSPNPATVVQSAMERPTAALPPAVCYHVYEELADRVLDGPRLIAAQGMCWRYEGEGFQPLERGWAFTMRELVCVSSSPKVERFRRGLIESALRLAGELELDARLEVASDPFFAPTARGRAMLQSIKSLKHEILLPIGGEREIAAASFNHHETFFGESFNIRMASGETAASGCAAFGIERWFLGFLVTHGPDARSWPTIRLPLRAAAVPSKGIARSAARANRSQTPLNLDQALP